MTELFLVPPGTTVNAKGDGSPLELGNTANRLYLLNLVISSIVEQEALDVSVYGSSDGAAWGPKPLLSFPQKFYRGEHPLLLDLTALPEIRFLRAHWDVNRWGRGSEIPMFQFHLSLKEVPRDLLQEAASETRARA